MKTTIEVSDDLYRRAKSEAALRGRKLKDLGRGTARPGKLRAKRAGQLCGIDDSPLPIAAPEAEHIGQAAKDKPSRKAILILGKVPHILLARCRSPFSNASNPVGGRNGLSQIRWPQGLT